MSPLNNLPRTSSRRSRLTRRSRVRGGFEDMEREGCGDGPLGRVLLVRRVVIGVYEVTRSSLFLACWGESGAVGSAGRSPGTVWLSAPPLPVVLHGGMASRMS